MSTGLVCPASEDEAFESWFSLSTWVWPLFSCPSMPCEIFNAERASSLRSERDPLVLFAEALFADDEDWDVTPWVPLAKLCDNWSACVNELCPSPDAFERLSLEEMALFSEKEPEVFVCGISKASAEGIVASFAVGPEIITVTWPFAFVTFLCASFTTIW